MQNINKAGFYWSYVINREKIISNEASSMLSFINLKNKKKEVNFVVIYT